MLSGILFLLFAVRSFQRVRPSVDPDPNFLRVPKLIGLAFLKSAGQQVKEATIKTKTAAIVSERFYRIVRAFYRYLAILTRGTGGRNRIYLFVLGEYVVSLLLLASSAILFWAMLDKAVLSPTDSPLSSFVQLAASSLIPALPPIASPPGLPKALLIGPTVSAFILFVLFVGPASSLLTYRQQAYAKNVAQAHEIFRRFAINFRHYIYYLRAVSKKLP
jgi:hypothetical protein